MAPATFNPGPARKSYFYQMDLMDDCTLGSCCQDRIRIQRTSSPMKKDSDAYSAARVRQRRRLSDVDADQCEYGV